MASGEQTTTTVTVTGADVGDVVMAAFSNALSGIWLFPEVSAADTVTVTFFNASDAAVDLSSGTLTCKVVD